MTTLTGKSGISLLVLLLATNTAFAAERLKLVLELQSSDQESGEPITAQLSPPEADFIVAPTIGGTPSTIQIDIYCSFFGAPVPNCDITNNPPAPAEPNTGGHMHSDGGRPLGALVPMQGNSGSDAILETTYTAPEASGVIRISGSGFHPNYGFFSGNFTIGVMVAGLQPLGSSTTYDLVGQRAAHPVNHYGTSSFNASLVSLAQSYAQKYPGQKLAYNDMSLLYGGLFDISGAWSPPHRSHRLGTDVDLRLVPVNQRQALQHLIQKSGISTILPEGDHWHLRQ